MEVNDQPLARSNSDGSLDIWTRGRRVRLPGEHGEPSTADDPTPPEDAGPLPADARCEVTRELTFISYRGWLVRSTDPAIEVLPSKPRRMPTRVYSRMARRRGR